MRHLRITTAMLLALAAPAFAETTVLNHVTVIDGTGAAPISDAAVTMTDGKITYVGPATGLKAPKDAKIQDMTGKFVLFGFFVCLVFFGLLLVVSLVVLFFS